MGADSTVSGKNESKPTPQRGESDENVEFDWGGISTKENSRGMDGVGVDNRTRTEEGVYEKIRGAKAIERGGSDWMSSHGDRKSGV